jgi:N-methylhydantoinase A/oxoprolinase/acetone carboxylase beta subunit
MSPADLRLGVAVGQTTVDAVAMDPSGRPVAKAKTPRTSDVADDIGATIGRVLESAEVEPSAIIRVALGTTHWTAPVREGKGFEPVAAIRIGGPLTHAVPPLATWPDRLRRAVSAGETIVRGGAEYDGRRLAELDRDAIRRFVGERAEGLGAVAITGVFSPVAADHELAAAEVVRGELGTGVRISLSHEIGSIGLLERENATVLNAALVRIARDLGDALDSTLAAAGIEAEPFFTQNDGTLMAVSYASRFPVLMLGTGPANSMRGAAHLSGVDGAVVVDAGGTRTDVGVLVNGFPRESTRGTELAGVRVGLRVADIRSLAIGGGSVVHMDGDEPTVGPDDAGADVGRRALVFGGDTPTLTDAAVAAGRAALGSHDLPDHLRARLSRAVEAVDRRIADVVDRAAAGSVGLPLVAVGGASMLVAGAVPGVSRIVRPADGEVAAAVGAAIAPVSGRAERICADRPDARRRTLLEVRAAAFERAVHAGADPDGVEVVEVEEVPLTYLADPAVRLRVTAVGPAG